MQETSIPQECKTHVPLTSSVIMHYKYPTIGLRKELPLLVKIYTHLLHYHYFWSEWSMSSTNLTIGGLLWVRDPRELSNILLVLVVTLRKILEVKILLERSQFSLKVNCILPSREKPVLSRSWPNPSFPREASSLQKLITYSWVNLNLLGSHPFEVGHIWRDSF